MDTPNRQHGYNPRPDLPPTPSGLVPSRSEARFANHTNTRGLTSEFRQTFLVVGPKLTSSVSVEMASKFHEFPPQKRLRLSEDAQSVSEDARPVARVASFSSYCSTSPKKDKLEITSKPYDKCKTIYVETIHISCESDVFFGNEYNYAGVITYQYHGKVDWRTRNGKHCKAGYVVIQDTDSKEVKQWIGQTDGVVHGAVYRNAFGEDVDTINVIGEGFSIMKGKFKINSGVFNNPSESEYHDSRKQMSEVSEYCVGKVVESWKKAGPAILGCRNFRVKDLLKDYYVGAIKLADMLNVNPYT